MPLVTAEERIGTVLGGKYELGRILGEGGMGSVFEALHQWTGRRVAVKLLHPTLATNALIGRRFLQEARTAAALEHPNVVQVLDMGVDEGAFYLVLELLIGEPLSDRLRRGTLTIEAALSTLLPVMSALAEAHDRGFIHRDLKPENIFLARQAGDTVAKVLDFGLAKVLEEEPSASSSTRTGMVVGTPYYLAPEQAKADRSIGPPADVWAMAVVVYECLSGKLPFQGDSPTAVLLNVCSEEPPALGAIEPKVPVGVSNVVMRALTKAPAKRYPDMRGFAQALVAAARDAGVKVDVPKGLSEGAAPAAPVPVPENPIARSPSPSTVMVRRSFSLAAFFVAAMAAGAVLAAGCFVVWLLVTSYAQPEVVVRELDPPDPPESASAPVEPPEPALVAPSVVEPAPVPPVVPVQPAVVEPAQPEVIEPPPAQREARVVRRPRRVVRPAAEPVRPLAPSRPARDPGLSGW